MQIAAERPETDHSTGHQRIDANGLARPEHEAAFALRHDLRRHREPFEATAFDDRGTRNAWGRPNISRRAGR
jgi:hypothetical protein